MVLRCHFDLYSSRGIQIDAIGDDFGSIALARRMARSVLLDFAAHHFSDGAECLVVCRIRTENPERYYLVSLVMLDDPIMAPGNLSQIPNDQKMSSETKFPTFDCREESEISYRMSADWMDLQELKSDGFLRSTRAPERAWIKSYIPSEERARVSAAIDRAIRFRTPFELEHMVIRADYSIGWTRSRAFPVLNEHGQISEWIGVAKDVTARH